MHFRTIVMVRTKMVRKCTKRGILIKIAKKNILALEFFWGLFLGYWITWHKNFWKKSPRNWLGRRFKKRTIFGYNKWIKKLTSMKLVTMFYRFCSIRIWSFWFFKWHNFTIKLNRIQISDSPHHHHTWHKPYYTKTPQTYKNGSMYIGGIHLKNCRLET